MKNANDNIPTDSPEAVAQVIERLGQANRAWLNIAAIEIAKWREDDRRMGIVWADEQERSA